MKKKHTRKIEGSFKYTLGIQQIHIHLLLYDICMPLNSEKYISWSRQHQGN